MKKITKYWMMACFYMLLSLIACETNPDEIVPDDDDDPQLIDDSPDDNDPPTDELDLNKVSDQLIFENSTSINGNIPASSKLTDLKMDKDTIFLVDGYKNRIRFLSTKTFASGISAYVQVKGADKYFDVSPPEKEITDSIFAIYIEINPGDLELPVNFTVEIVVHENGNPIDGFEKEVAIETENDGSCNFQSGESVWEWISTINNGSLHTAPMYAHTTPGVVAGCCDSDGNSYYANCINTPSHSVVDYESVFMVNLEFLKFLEGGDVVGELNQFTQNVRPSETDFCGKSPGYTRVNVHNSYNGKYTYEASNCTISIASLAGETEPVLASDGTKLGEINLPIYAGSGPIVQYKILSKHFMIESRNNEGPALERLYERRTVFGFEWYD